MPAAKGFGVKTDVTAPKGATLFRSGAGQAAPVPGLRGGPLADDLRLAGLGHGPLLDFREVGPEQREPVRAVPEQIAVDEDDGNVARDVVSHACTREERVRKSNECIGSVAERWLHG